MDRSLEMPDLAQYSDTPRYNMQAVERATGLSPRTLRSWERRYGTPAPRRDAGGRRAYSERDIALIRWLTNRVGEGLSIGRAVAMLSESGVDRGDSRLSSDLDRAQLRLLQAIDWMDEEEARLILAQAAVELPMEDLVLGLIQPVLYRVGDLWAAGRMSVASEHFGTEILRTALGDLLARCPQPWRPHHVLVGCAPGELHDLGALALAIFLRRAGFRVTYVGASVEGTSLLADLQRIQPAALCLSATTEDAAGALADLFSELQPAYDGVLAYGGSAFGHYGSARPSIPGLYLDTDVRRAVLLLEQTVAEQARPIE